MALSISVKNHFLIQQFLKFKINFYFFSIICKVSYQFVKIPERKFRRTMRAFDIYQNTIKNNFFEKSLLKELIQLRLLIIDEVFQKELGFSLKTQQKTFKEIREIFKIIRNKIGYREFYIIKKMGNLEKISNLDRKKSILKLVKLPENLEELMLKKIQQKNVIKI